MKRLRLMMGFILSIGIFSSVTGCGLGQLINPPVKTVSAVGKKQVTVQIVDSTFDPQVIHVSAGATVTWVNSDMMTHTVMSSDGMLHSGDIQPGQKFSYQFTKTGTYNYMCSYHPSMTGTVIVGNSTSSTTSSGSSMSTDMDMSSSNTTNTAATSIAPVGSGTQGEPLQADGTRLLPYKMENGYKVFHLTAKPVWWVVKKGEKPVESWAFNGTVPGPEIRVDEGDKVKIIVTNDLPEGTTVHWHGLDVPFADDGVGGISQPDILPGHSFTYTFTIHTPAGTYMYHSHPMNDMAHQEQMGLFGPFIVEPKGTAWQQVHPGYNDEFTLMLNDSSEFGYTINGKSYPSTPILPVKLGDKVLVHLINIGNMDHSMHLHGFHFQVIGQDGFPTPYQQWLDTVLIAPGSTYDLSFTADQAGKWLFHCHMLPHVTSGTQMTGMITLFNVH